MYMYTYIYLLCMRKLIAYFIYYNGMFSVYLLL
jgi:hypothetical protein